MDARPWPRKSPTTCYLGTSQIMTKTTTESQNRWHVGDVTVSRIIELESVFPTEVMMVGVTPERIKSIGWLSPAYADPNGMLRYSVHAFVIESRGRRIIVDTCVGNDKPRVGEWNNLQVPFLDRLVEAGFPLDSIDTVLCTHLHMDHVGWNTRLVGNTWLPTFPRARYLFGRIEWEHWSNKAHGLGDMPQFVADFAMLDTAISDSVEPIVAAGLHELVEVDHRITDEVTLTPTPGHTPGHVSVVIRSRGAEAVITGDAILHPVQIADPEVGSTFDADRARATKTRQDFIRTRADRDILVLGTHFTTPSGGKIVKKGDGWRLVPFGKRA
jgi:glyoxylase-like metal-dependent hydrolase (beta-lactamase superfamily II)